MLQDLKWQSLEERPRLLRLEMMFCIRFDIIDINWSSYLIPLTSTTRGHQTRFMQQHCHIDGFAHSFFPRTTRDWNSLQCEPAAYPTINAFKTALRVELPFSIHRSSSSPVFTCTLYAFARVILDGPRATIPAVRDKTWPVKV